MISESILNEATARLVSRFHPEKIILFGSQARGTAHPRSDVDLLVICDVIGRRHDLLVEMYRALGGIDMAPELVVMTPKEYELDQQITGTIARPASREGRVLHTQLQKETGYSKGELEARKLRKVRQWIELAEGDLDVAYALREMKKSNTSIQIAFYAQQTVEKYIKAWLCLNDVEIPHTHDILKLRLVYEGEAGSQAVDLSGADRLMPYEAEYSHPEDLIEVTEEDAERAVQIAAEVSGAMRSVLKRDLAERYATGTDEEVQKEYTQLNL